ncbi:hypothetical protein ITG09_06775 [Vibrio cyclitrophicus]|nr:hypothetical protein [Vibrio cyclitrophicus]UPR53321.1 hypothetical protein ITG09_06775 [Vibrio cyclitrophicus]
MSNRFIECSVHGKQQETFVCQHIVQSLEDKKARGFWWSETPGNERSDAWCSECESKVKDTNGEWTPEILAFAKVTLLCGACYDQAKLINFPKLINKPWWKIW